MVMSRAIKVDGKVRTEKCYPAGFMGAWRRHIQSLAAPTHTQSTRWNSCAQC